VTLKSKVISLGVAEWVTNLRWEILSGNRTLNNSLLNSPQKAFCATVGQRTDGSRVQLVWTPLCGVLSSEPLISWLQQGSIKLLKLNHGEHFSTLKVYKVDKCRHIQGCCKDLFSVELEPASGTWAHSQVTGTEVSMSSYHRGLQGAAPGPWQVPHLGFMTVHVYLGSLRPAASNGCGCSAWHSGV
jgi:hypothetical protein